MSVSGDADRCDVRRRLRLAEALALKPADVNLDAGEIRALHDKGDGRVPLTSVHPRELRRSETGGLSCDRGAKGKSRIA